MPYIDDTLRQEIDEGREPINNPGELNYRITSIILDYIASKGELSYWRINDILGVLEGIKLEFYRRVVVPYEEKKRKENGDVYPKSEVTIENVKKTEYNACYYCEGTGLSSVGPGGCKSCGGIGKVEREIPF